MAFFTNVQVGNLQGVPIVGTLDGTVTRSGNNVILSNLVLSLRAASNVSGTKNFVFILDRIGNSLSINAPTPTTVLGDFALTTVSFTVVSSDWQGRIYWSTSDGVNGSFLVAFPVAPDIPTVTSAGTGFRSISITYGTTSFGAPNSGTVTLYGGTSDNPTTLIDSYSQTGDKTFVLSNVLPSTTYYFRARAGNSQLNSDYSTTITVTSQRDPKFLGSVNGQTKEIKKLYGSVNGQTKEIKKLYGSVNGQTKVIYSS